MRGNLTELYQDIILDHNRRPRNFHPMDDATRRVEGRNPLCGDELTLWLRLEGDVIADASFVGSGCAVSKASASLMTSAVKGKTVAQAGALFERFHQLVTGKLPPENGLGEDRLGVFAGVARFPIRVKCASLAWHALRRALDDGAAAEPVSTE